MKKIYSKPDIIFEDFSLSTNIASCEMKNENYAQNECSYTVETVKGNKDVFYEGISACTTTDSLGTYDYLCYHNPTETGNLFNS